jgi:hypothetical protein
MLKKISIGLKGGMLFKSFEKAVKDPHAVQQNFLRNILQNNENTEFGKLYNFADIKNETDFQNKVPLFSYEELEQFIKKMISGKGKVLTFDKPTMFNVTSGTGGTSKYIPITHESQKLTTQLTTQWLYRMLCDHPRILNDSTLGVTGAAIEGYTLSGVPHGCASGMIYKNLPWLFARSYVIPYSVSEIDDYDLKYYLMIRLALATKISFIATPNPTTLLRLAEIGIKYQESIIRSIHDGKLWDEKLNFNKEKYQNILRHIQSGLKPMPSRTNFLDKIVEANGKLIPSKCWPELQLVACWLGGSVGFKAEALNEFYGPDTPKRDLGLLASEGSITLPHKDHSPSGILAIQNNYYEFIPEANINERRPPILLSHELEIGKRYFVLLTTTNGLYRYDINDIVEVTGYYQKTPELSFVSKGQDMTSITGEKMHSNHFILALNKLKALFNISIRQFRAVPNMEKNRYEIFLNIDSETTDDFLLDIVIPALDEALSDVNIEYKQKRKSGRLQGPCLHLMDDGWEKIVMTDSIKSGQRDTQYKWKQLCPSPHPLDLDNVKHSIGL